MLDFHLIFVAVGVEAPGEDRFWKASFFVAIRKLHLVNRQFVCARDKRLVSVKNFVAFLKLAENLALRG